MKQVTIALITLSLLSSCARYIPGGIPVKIDSIYYAQDTSVQNFQEVVVVGTSGVQAPVPTANFRTVMIYYGTDRETIPLADRTISYGPEPKNIDEPYKVGFTTISIPLTHTTGEIERPSIWKFEISENESKHIIQKKIVQLRKSEFDSLIYKASIGTDAFIFVHGYNTSFQDAAFRTAQLAYDINLPIIPFMFSWASDGHLIDYFHDDKHVRVALPSFKDFIKRVAREGRFNKIHLIAHSMGNRLITQALYDLRDDPANLKIDQIIMASPDIEADIFKSQFAESLVKRSQRVTVYAAKSDWALKTSNFLNGELRLGQVGLPPFVVNKVDIIDADKVKTDFLGHARFAKSPKIISDMFKLFKYHLDPVARGIQHEVIDSSDYYYFKP